MAAVTDVNYAFTPDQHARELRRAVVAATVGTTIEWYDFLLYSTMAGLVFGKLFFPNDDPLTATLNSFGIYFVGFLARPVGAFIFGHYGDRIGRKSTLIVTLLLMGISTFLVAFLPGYAVDRRVGRGALDRTAPAARHRGRRRMGRLRSAFHGMGPPQQRTRLSRHPGRNSAAPPACSLPILPFLSSAECRAMRFSPGAGAFHLR